MKAPSSNYCQVTIVEVLILQRFPFGKDSTFFYVAAGGNNKVRIGDVIKVPWRNNAISGVVVKTKIIRLKKNSSAAEKINLSKAVSDDRYFYSKLPKRAIALKNIGEIIENEYLKPELLAKLKIAANQYCVSWNHFVKSVVYLPVKMRKSKISYFKLFKKWLPLLKPDSLKYSKKEVYANLKEKKIPYLFISNSQTAQLKGLLKSTFYSRKQILVVVPEKAQLFPLAAKYALLTNSYALSTPIILGKFLSSSVFREAWQLTRDEPPHLFIGTRSSIFAPFGNIGLIILEEGNDPSLKQWDLTPLYDTRYLLSLFYPNVPKIYLSSTPRIQDFYDSPYYLSEDSKFKISKYNVKPPRKEKAKIADVYEESSHIVTRQVDYENRKIKVALINMVLENKYHKEPVPLSSYLQKELASVLKNGLWSLLLVNHKGIANVIICRDCGYIPRCPNCGKNLSVHDKLVFQCNFCGEMQKSFSRCPKCSGYNLILGSFGIEKVKEALSKLQKKINFNVLVAPNPQSSSSELISFWNNLAENVDKPTVLLGYSGLLPIARLFKKRIGLAAILSFDDLLFYSDYRSEERAAARYFNLLSVAPKVIIQTQDPNQLFFQKVSAHSYSSLFSDWARERKEFHYPPFTKLVRLEKSSAAERDNPNFIARMGQFMEKQGSVLETNITTAGLLVKYNKGADLSLAFRKLFRIFGRVKVDPDPEVII